MKEVSRLWRLASLVAVFSLIAVSFPTMTVNVKAEERFEELGTPLAQGNVPLDVAWSHDSTKALIGTHYTPDDKGHLIEYSSGVLREVHTEPGRFSFNGIDYRPFDNTALIVGSVGSDGFVAEYDGVSFRRIGGLYKDTTFYDVAWSPSGSLAIIVGYQYNGYSSKVLKYDGSGLTDISPAGNLGALTRVDWRPIGFEALLLAGEAQTLYRYDGSKISLVGSMYNAAVSFLTDVSWNPSGTYAIVIGYNSNVIFRYSNAGISRTYIASPGKYGGFWAVDWEPLNGAYALLVTDSGNGVKVDSKSFKPAGMISSGSGQLFREIAWRGSGDMALVLAGWGAPRGSVWKFVPETSEEYQPPTVEQNPWFDWVFKGVDYQLEYRIQNPDPLHTVDVEIEIEEWSEGLFTDRYTLRCTIPRGSTIPCKVTLFSVDHEWEWAGGSIFGRFVDMLSSGVSEIDIAIETGEELVDNADRLQKASYPGIRTIKDWVEKAKPVFKSKVWQVGSEFLDLVGLVNAFYKFATVKFDKLYEYRVTEVTVRYEDGSTSSTIDGIEGSFAVNIFVPEEKVLALYGSMVANAIANMATLMAPALAAASAACLGCAGIIAAAAEGIYIVADWLWISPTVENDPVDDEFMDVFTPKYYDPGLNKSSDEIGETLRKSVYDEEDLEHHDLSGFVGDGQAMLVSYFRFLGARDSNNPQSMAIQYQAMTKYAIKLRKDVQRIDERYEELLNMLDSRGLMPSVEDLKDTQDAVKNGTYEYFDVEEDIFDDFLIPDDEREEYWQLVKNIHPDWYQNIHLLGNLDQLWPILPPNIRTSPVGGAFPLPDFPIAKLTSAKSIFDEGELACFGATASWIPAGVTVLGFTYDFDGDGLADAVGSDVCKVWFDDMDSFTVTLTLRAVAFITETDQAGNPISFPVYMETSDAVTVRVANVPPSVNVQYFFNVTISFSITGERLHDVDLYLFEDTTEIGYANIVRYPGNPDAMSVELAGLSLNLSRMYSFVAHYTPLNDPVNGHVWGANPGFLTLAFDDGEEKRSHTFNVRREASWTWAVDDLSSYFLNHNVTFMATAYDPGSDDLTFSWKWADGTMIEHTYYFNGNTPDPYPSPDGHSVTVTDSVVRMYNPSMANKLVLAVEDDDGGVGEIELPLTP